MNTTRITNVLKLALIGSALVASGCATFATSKSRPLADDVLQQHKGDVQGLYNAWIKPQTTVRHQHDGSTVDILPPTDLDTMKATEAAVAKDFGRFCKSSGGSLDIQPQKYGQHNVCTDASGYLGEIDTERFHWGLVFSEDSRQQRQQRAQEDAQIKAATERADYELLAPEKLITLDQSTLASLISEFAGNDPRNRIPKAKARLAVLQAETEKRAMEQERQREAQAKLALAAKRRAQEHRQAGDRVCYVTDDMTMKQPTGMVILGEEQYRQVRGTTRVVGFVEGMNPVNRKIQIRISGITFFAEGTSQSVDAMDFTNGMIFHVNDVIWDSTYRWNGC